MLKDDHQTLNSVPVSFSQQVGGARAGAEKGIQRPASAALGGKQTETGGK